MKGRSLRSFSTLKAIRFFQQALTRPLDCGMPKLENAFKLWRVMRTKSFRVCLTTKVTQLSQDLRTTLAEYGETAKYTRKSELKTTFIDSFSYSLLLADLLPLYFTLVTD